MRGKASRLSGGAFLAALVVLAASCSRGPEGVDLIRSGRSRLAEGAAAGLGAAEVRASIGNPRRIHDVVRASLPATPPSRFRFVTDVPPDGRLVLAAGIPARYWGASAVEFVVSVRRGGRETILLDRLVDPANRPADRGWVPLEAGLSGHAGKGVEIVLETRGFEDTAPPDRAFWGTPTVTTSRDDDAPLVVVFLVDALRADHLPLYGYSRDTAPELTRFARDAVVFDQAIAAASWTKPSVASLFTSVLPRQHGCIRFFGILDPGLVTLAERLRERGYATGGVVENPLVGAKDMQFDQGFDQFELPASRHAGVAVDGALAFLDARRGQPSFVYAHTMDTHVPYLPPPPFDRRFPPPPGPKGEGARPFADYQEPADRDRIVARYDGAIAYADREFGRLLRQLRERGLYDRALIVFLSDHGEELLDHGGWDHGRTLFDELVRVPLVVKYPHGREAGRRVDRQVQLVDVLPTILRSQGMREPPGIVGRPLEDSFHETGPERPAVLETSYRESAAYGVRTSQAKYVRLFYPASVELLFDLRHDPGEKQGRDVAGSSAAQPFRKLAETALASLHRLVLVDSDEECELRFETTGWLQVVSRAGLVASDHAQVADGGHGLVLRLERHPDRLRPVEVEFATRPPGAPLWIDGKHGGRPLKASEISVGQTRVLEEGPPFLVGNDEGDDVRSRAVPRTRSDVLVSLVIPRVGPTATLDPETRESLKELGYLQ